MGTGSVFRENSKEGDMKKRDILVKVKWALGSYQLRFDVSLFTDESKADLTLPPTGQSAHPLHQICTKSPQILLISVITVARTDVMLDAVRQGNALWTLSRIRRAA